MKKVYLLLAMFMIMMNVEAQTDPNIFEKFKSETLIIDGYKINIEVLGEGEPIMFLPGGPGNPHDYMQGAFGHYHKTNKVIFFDWLGRGLSEDAKDVSEYSVANDVHFMEEIRKALKVEKMGLVGHSYGTVPAQAYAIKYPEHVSKLVLIAGFHSGEMWQANCDSYNHYTKTHFPETWAKVDSLRALGYISSDTTFSKVYGSVPTRYIYYHNTKARGNSPKDPNIRWFAMDVYYGIIGRDADFFVSGSMMDTDFRKDLKNLKMPTLIMAGRYDGVSTPEFNIQYKTYMPQAEFVMFEDSAHNPYIEEKEKFYKILDKFLAK